MIAVLDLFAGASGGWSLGMSRTGYRTVAACEIDPWRNAVFAANHPGCRMYADVRDLSASRLVSDLGYLPSVIVGSPPCQDISAANTRGQGIDGKRSGLFWEWIRLVHEIRPVWTCAENSPRLRTLGYDALAAELEAIGYACWPLVVGAENAGANHRRKRVWIVAADADRAHGWQQALPNGTATHHRSCADDGHAARIRCGEVRPKSTEQGNGADCGQHDPHPDRQGQHGCARNGEMEGGMDGFAADAECSERGPISSEACGMERPHGNAGRQQDSGRAGACLAGNAPHPHSPRYPLRPRERRDDGEELPPALRAIGSAWPDWNNGLSGLAEACAAAGFGALDDGSDACLPAGVRNRAIAALGDAVLPQIAYAIGKVMGNLT